MGKTPKPETISSAEQDARLPAVESILRDELASGDRALRGVPAVLSHMLGVAGQSLVNEAVVARLRGMLEDLATQLLSAREAALRSAPDADEVDRLADHLSGDTVVLSYCYALAMEGQITEKIERKASLDPVLSPLLQELIASDKDGIADLAMSAMAAQARFVQSQRRMNLPSAELPAEIFHAVIKRWQALDKGDPAIEPAIKSLKANYDEGSSRVGVLARLVGSMRKGALAALDLEHAGFALFVSALSTLSNQPRELAILACHEQQSARLALSLRAAGLDAGKIERQFTILDPSERLLSDLGEVTPQAARALLSRSAAKSGE